MTVATYETLYESGIAFGCRKALEAEIETRDIEIQYKQLQEEVARAKKRIQELRAEINTEEEQSKQRINMQQIRHEEKMDFLKKANKQLKEQINYISSFESS
ncbi:33 kDa inner dynein arm light chain, axonemal-like [Parasteatoda tepidariorum]|uniref:33 kDa inner dynein arm light chain, axonemal-like n=1 Tax=Parasteatoda tepidariorum TaxID=114398 RepID=UPI00077F8229|nr:33 kDa inner dynein arm light chain, axonemal-like [Parasteatoda tepidariorum]